MEAIIFALVSYIGWGVGDIFNVFVARKLGAYSTSFLFTLGMLLISIFYGPFVLADLKNLTTEILLLNLSLGLLLAIAALCFNKGIQIGNPSLVGTIASSFAALVVVFSIIFLGERVNGNQLFAIVIIFTGIILASLNFAALKREKNLINKGVLFALAAMLLWGLYFTFIKIPIREIGWFWPSVISSFSTLVLLSLVRLRGVRLVKPKENKTLIYLILTIITVKSAELSFNYALSKGLTVVVAPIAGSYATLFVVLAFFIFKDPITRQQILGIITTLIGIVLLSIFSV